MFFVSTIKNCYNPILFKQISKSFSSYFQKKFVIDLEIFLNIFVKLWKMMAQTCKGLCIRFKRMSFPSNLRYKMGQRWCSLCALFFFTSEIMCPCCKTRLRSKARSKKKNLISISSRNPMMLSHE